MDRAVRDPRFTNLEKLPGELALSSRLITYAVGDLREGGTPTVHRRMRHGVFGAPGRCQTTPSARSGRARILTPRDQWNPRAAAATDAPRCAAINTPRVVGDVGSNRRVDYTVSATVRRGGLEANVGRGNEITSRLDPELWARGTAEFPASPAQGSRRKTRLRLLRGTGADAPSTDAGPLTGNQASRRGAPLDAGLRTICSSAGDPFLASRVPATSSGALSPTRWAGRSKSRLELARCTAPLALCVDARSVGAEGIARTALAIGDLAPICAG